MKKFWNSDKIVSTSAIVIGVGSLIVVTYQTNLIRNQTELIQREQRTSVMPYLGMEGRSVSQNWYEYHLENSGLGPALVREVRVRTDKETLPIDIVKYFQKNYWIEGQGNYVFSAIEVGDLFPAGEDFTLIGANPKDTAFLNFAMPFEKGDAIFEIVYESLYGERWLLSSVKNAPVRLEEED